MDRIDGSKIQSCAVSSRSLLDENGYDQWQQIDQLQKEDYGHAHDGQWPSRTVRWRNLCRESAQIGTQYDNEADKWNSLSLFATDSEHDDRQGNRYQIGWTSWSLVWCREYQEDVNTRLDFDMSSTGMKLSNIWTNTHVRRTSKSWRKHGLRNSRGFDWVRDFHELCARRKSSSN
jgi:hypothetical protein